VKLAYRLLLLMGQPLGDFALPLLKRQCERAGTSPDTLTPDQAELMLPALGRVLEVFVGRRRDFEGLIHEMRLEIGNERYTENRREQVAARAERPRDGKTVHPEGG
jgi:hypothetical protein